MLHKSEDINHDGGIASWQLWLALTGAWLLIYVIIHHGIESSGKAVYFTATLPYAVLIIMVVRGVTLPGAAKGLEFYLVPDLGRLTDGRVWADAGTQVFYSLGPGWGSLATVRGGGGGHGGKRL